MKIKELLYRQLFFYPIGIFALTVTSDDNLLFGGRKPPPYNKYYLLKNPRRFLVGGRKINGVKENY